MISIRPLALLAWTMALGALAPAAPAQMLYWTGLDTDSIYRSRLDGSNVERVLGPVDGLRDPRHLAVDHVGGKMYWVEETRIKRANLDGTGIEIIIGTHFNGHGIDVDEVGRQIYYVTASVGGGAIHRANLDGTSRETIVTGQDNPVGLDVDGAGGKVYWVWGFIQTPGGVRRANLDGTQVQNLASNQGRPLDVAVDPIEQSLFFTDQELDSVKRAGLDGSGLQTIASGQPLPQGIDYFDGWVYWTEVIERKIWRSWPDGSNRELVLEHTDSPRGLAIVVPEPAGLTLLLPVALLAGRASRSSRQ